MSSSRSSSSSSNELQRGIRATRLDLLPPGVERDAVICAIFDSLSVIEQLAWIEQVGAPPPGWKPKD